MKARYKHLQSLSLSMALSAIEIYNKPNFPCRDQIFPILMVNAWESLAKAKVLKDNKGQIQSIRVKDGRRYKKKSNGEYFTIGAISALRKCEVPQVVVDNLGHLVDIRDEATHLPKDSTALPLLIYNLGSATLKSYALLSREWFNVGLREYDFYILPLGFSYPFSTLASLDLSNEPETIARIASEVAANQKLERDENGHMLVCEIRPQLVSARKVDGDPDWTVGIDTDAADLVVTRQVDSLDRYPFSYRDVWERLKLEFPHIKQRQLNDIIKTYSVKDEPHYSGYIYTSKTDRSMGPKKGTRSAYNQNFVQFCIHEFGKLAE